MLKKGSGTTEQSEISAFLGKGTEFKGVLSFEGTIRVDGKIDGEVISKDTLIAGDGAFLQGEISVGRSYRAARSSATSMQASRCTCSPRPTSREI